MIYQVQQTESQCPECSRLRRHSSCSQSESSVQEQRKIIIPINKHTIENNQNIQRTLNLLQLEVERLKKQNIVKERKIKKLQAQMNNKQIRFYPQNAKIGAIYQNDIQSNYKSPKSKRNYTQYYGQQNIQNNINHRDYKSNRNTSRQKYASSRALIEVNDIQRRIKQMSDLKNEKIYHLQSALQKITEQNNQLSKKLEEQVKDNEWLTKFCLSFVNMAGQVSNMQGKKLIQPTVSLRKNTKLAWKFFKSFIKQVMV